MQRSSLAPLVAIALLPAVAVLPTAGCSNGPRHASGPVPDGLLGHLAGSDAMTIHATHPYEHEFMEGGEFEDRADTVPRFHGQPVLGTAQVTDAALRDRLLALVERGIEASDGRVAMCFDPRHALSIVKDGRVTDLLICFECYSMSVWVDGAKLEGHLTARSVEPGVSAIFEDLGLAIAE